MSTSVPAFDPRTPPDRLLRDLRSRREGLAQGEADRRLITAGPNELARTGRRGWARSLARQFNHPLALLLWAAAALAAVTGTTALSIAIVTVVVINALFSFAQEQRAERAIEALAAYLPPQATVRRDGHRELIPARALVPGDILLISEGDRISADARLLDGDVEIDASALTGESLPVSRSSSNGELDVGFLEARDLVFSGTTCTGGEAEAVVFATGMGTELGRIAALSQQVRTGESPLEHQIRRVAWLISAVAVGVGLVFLAVGSLVARLPIADAATFSVGLLVANVPEGLLPTITLALAVGVRVLARRGALVKQLSAVETLGSTTVICTDKTGTLTENRMRVTDIWTASGSVDIGDIEASEVTVPAAVRSLAAVVSACNSAELGVESADAVGDPTEIALLRVAKMLGTDVSVDRRHALRRRVFHFDPGLKLMSTVSVDGDELVVQTKGAPEEVLARCHRIMGADGTERALSIDDRRSVSEGLNRSATQGLRVLGVARRVITNGRVPSGRLEGESDLCFIGLVSMFDPPREEVRDAVGRCHAAGIRINVVTGDNGLTAAEISRRVGIEAEAIVTGAELDLLTDPELHELLGARRELIFARSSPEAKLRIADALRAQGEVVAMTGDGVNDAPALHRADIGIAMGRSGTDVAREAATMILTDDNFATIVTAVEEGRRVYANVRKFIFYIFVHLTPELVPFLVFALSGGAIPLPLTVLAILAVDLGTETLPALALGREPAEPGLMERPPRRREEGVIRPAMLVRAWLFLGVLSAALVLGGFFFVLLRAGWHPGMSVGVHSRLHHAYRQATTMTFLGIVVCQIGTAFAARTERASLRTVGVFTNRLLLWGVAFELGIAAVVVAIPAVQSLFGTAVPPGPALGLLLSFPLVVWGVDELYRWVVRRRSTEG